MHIIEKKEYYLTQFITMHKNTLNVKGNPLFSLNFSFVCRIQIERTYLILFLFYLIFLCYYLIILYSLRKVFLEIAETNNIKITKTHQKTHC